MAIQLRTADDIKRLVSAFGDFSEPLAQTDLSLHDVEDLALQPQATVSLDDIDTSGLLLSTLVAVATGWVAIKGFERNAGSMGWGMTWAALGFLMPLPAVLYAALQKEN